MKFVRVGALAALISVPSLSVAQTEAEAMQTILKQACSAKIAQTEASLNETNAKLLEIEIAKEQMLETFVYPTVKYATAAFAMDAPVIAAMLSEQTRELGATYNRLYRRIETATDIDKVTKDTMKEYLRQVHMERLAKSIEADLEKALGKQEGISRNGNWIAAGSWGVFYMPTGPVDALTIRQVHRQQNFKSVPGVALDPMKSVSVSIEQHYNLVTKQTDFQPKLSDPIELAKIFVPKNGTMESRVMFFSDSQASQSQEQMKYLLGDQSYRACRAQFP